MENELYRELNGGMTPRIFFDKLTKLYYIAYPHVGKVVVTKVVSYPEITIIINSKPYLIQPALLWDHHGKPCEAQSALGSGGEYPSIEDFDFSKPNFTKLSIEDILVEA